MTPVVAAVVGGRFDGSDVDGLTEDQMPSIPQKRYLQDYAKTKAMGELAVSQACSADLMTVAIAPHQVDPSPSQPSMPCLFLIP